MEEKKKFKLGLLPKLIIAIIVGILFGQFLPEGFCRFVVTLSSFFSQFLSFIIPLMILAYVTMGIANLKSGAGKLLLITVAIAYCSTLIAGSASFFVADTLFPHFMSADALDKIAATAGNSLEPYFSLEIPALMNTLLLRRLCSVCACPACAARPLATRCTTAFPTSPASLTAYCTRSSFRCCRFTSAARSPI